MMIRVTANSLTIRDTAWKTNVIHVPSFAAMEADEEVFSQKAITFFCPFAVSPQLMNVKEHTNEMVEQLDEKAKGQCFVSVDGHHKWKTGVPLREMV